MKRLLTAFTLQAVTDGKPFKQLFSRNSTMARKIVGDGGSKIPASKLQQLVQQYLMAKRH